MNDRPHPIAPTKHSMKRRAPWHDYRAPGTYMLTLAVEGRRPLFGKLKFGHDMTENNAQVHVELSPLGETIRSGRL